jgi:glycosyltransferase involved in cell wall biosynthesis
MWKIGAGGAELSVRHYAEHLGRNYNCSAYSLRPGDTAFFDTKKINVTENSSRGVLLYLNYFKYCRRHRNNIFHLLNAGPIILVLTLLSGVKKTLYHIHGTKYWKKAYDKIYKKPFWIVASWFNVKFVANSIFSAAVFNQEVSPVVTEVIYNGFDVENFVKKRSMRKSLKRIGYAGRFHKGKNVELVIRLFEEVAEGRPELELILAGDGPLRKSLEAMAANSPYRDRIQFLGFVNDMPSFYSALDLFVFLSDHESFGNVLAEALLTGLPVVTSNLSVFKEIYGEEEDFVLGNPDNYEELKSRFLKSINHFDSLAQKAFDTSEQIKMKFAVSQHVAKIERIYESL